MKKDKAYNCQGTDGNVDSIASQICESSGCQNLLRKLKNGLKCYIIC